MKSRGSALRSINQTFLDEISAMNSVVGSEIFVKVGQPLLPTVDCFTFGGLVKLFHANLDVLLADNDRIREMENLDFFICE